MWRHQSERTRHAVDVWGSSLYRHLCDVIKVSERDTQSTCEDRLFTIIYVTSSKWANETRSRCVRIVSLPSFMWRHQSERTRHAVDVWGSSLYRHLCDVIKVSERDTQSMCEDRLFTVIYVTSSKWANETRSRCVRIVSLPSFMWRHQSERTRHAVDVWGSSLYRHLCDVIKVSERDTQSMCEDRLFTVIYVTSSKWANETRSRCVRIVSLPSFMSQWRHIRNKIIYTLSWPIFMLSLKLYFGVYFPPLFATKKMTLSWAHKQFATQVHTLLYLNASQESTKNW